MHFIWTPAVDEAYKALKSRFTSAPILQVPDAEQQFVVEVDALDVGVGAVLSKRSTADQKLHQCAFISWGLSSHVRELLVVKEALEKWRH